MSTPSLALVGRFGSPLHVYEESKIRESCRALRDAFTLDGVEFLYAAKANPHPAILRLVAEEGLGIDAVSIGEVLCARRAGIPRDKISYTGNNVGDEEMAAVTTEGVHVTADGLSQLIRWSRFLPARAAVGLRINPDVGDGHHDHVITGGPDSKFGVPTEEVEDALALANKVGLTIDALQQHIGSGILDSGVFLRTMSILLEVARRIPKLAIVDFGGGFGIPYLQGEAPFPMAEFGLEAEKLLQRFREDHAPDVSFRFEPGRYVVGAAGTLFVTVTAIKRTRRHTWVGTDSGMNHLIRPALYGSLHQVTNVSRPNSNVERVSVVGNICESGDVLARDIPLPRPEEGDILAIHDTGAYGSAMASTYNLRPRPAEILNTQKGPRLIRPRESLENLLADLEGAPSAG